ncbi:unnamed protein product, partial [Leptidea sinapis]
AVYRVPWELHNQIQSKIQKVTGGLTRLASRSKVKRDEAGNSRPRLSKQHALAYMQDHVQLVRQAWLVSGQCAANTGAHTTRYVQAEWAGAWRELTRERALWGPARASPLDNNRDSVVDVSNEDGSPSDLVSSGVVSRGLNQSTE